MKKVRGYTLIELIITIAFIGILLLFVAGAIAFAVFGTMSTDHHVVSTQASAFAANFHDVERVTCMQEKNFNGYFPCTVFRIDGTTTLIECTEKGCFIPNAASGLVLE